mgnify:CR=1 FL=1
MHWYNDRSRAGVAAVPCHLVFPPALTGVRAPIVMALGSFFPMIGAHKVLAAYGCLIPYLVTGRFDPAHHSGGLAVDRELLPRRDRDLAHPRLPRHCRAARGHERGALRVARAPGCSRPEDIVRTPARRATSRRSTTRLRRAGARSGQCRPQPVCRIRQLCRPLRVHRPRTRGRLRGAARGPAGVAAGGLCRGLRLGRHASRPATTSRSATAPASSRPRRANARPCCATGMASTTSRASATSTCPLIHNVMNTDIVVGVSDRSHRRARPLVQQRDRAVLSGGPPPYRPAAARRAEVHRPLRRSPIWSPRSRPQSVWNWARMT